MMTSTSNHQFFDSPRVSQQLRNDRCQNILYKAVFEHFNKIKSIAALLLASKSFQNSSFGPNYIVNFVLEKDVVGLIEAVLSPSSCFSLQFVPSLYIKQSAFHSEEINRGISNFVGELASTKYLRLSLRSLTLDNATKEVVSRFFASRHIRWPQLHHLTLRNCGVDDSDLALVSKSAVQLRAVDLGNNWRVTDAGLEHISKLANVTSLNLTSCDKITDGGIEHIVKLSNITSLNLYHCRMVCDAGLQLLSKLSSIKSLDVSGCKQITDVGLEHVSKISNMSSLNLADCYLITDSGLEPISKLSRITFLDVSGCIWITDAGLERVSCLSRIAVLNFRNCRKITDIGLGHLAKLSSITSLNLQGCDKISDDGLEVLSKLSSITFLNLKQCNMITVAAKKKFENCVVD